MKYTIKRSLACVYVCVCVGGGGGVGWLLDLLFFGFVFNVVWVFFYVVFFCCCLFFVLFLFFVCFLGG